MKKVMKVVAALMLIMFIAVGCNKEKVGHVYVDLGLPSGTLWATCNVGASAPEEFGDYFAWGETSTKAKYNWKNYKYCKNGYSRNLTKYCNDPNEGYKGFTDELTELQPCDDAASVKWGREWCTPTRFQWEELYQNTSVTYTALNGVSGLLFVSNNGNSLFLPAALSRWDDEIEDSHSGKGLYWSSSLGTIGPMGACRFTFSRYDVCGLSDIDSPRARGQSIRPVRSVK